MTADEPTPDDGENVTDGIDYEQLGRQTAARELKRAAYRTSRELERLSEQVQDGELDEDDAARAAKELATAEVWLARARSGEHLPAREVLDHD